ncbi:hypothetical protein LJ655_15585 [Paraburkholderia sp. MMS20-SJTN17]|uniref:Glycosyl hydrolase family 71 n=1 Tax=Paraburkholderia translucens TaxID=2886945 RepID=A0ABS8KEU6_9BURK|nr:hypothetical protein [Paraburkholderia sp. MMS20-SJTN17]MCC8403295.1 hypothetical protein [Paraburkholderia sp. MMS20-SJTN17]
MKTFKRILLATLLSVSAWTAFAADDAPSALSAPNTSGSLRFKGSSNGNLPGTASISKINVHTLLYPGSTTQVLAHYLPWWGPDPRGLDAGYRSDDPAQARRTFADMRSRGIDGLIVDWYGEGHFVDKAWKASMPILADFPELTFSIMIDSGAFKFNACKGCDLTQTILHHLDYVAREYFPSRQYLRYHGRPVAFEFGMEAVGQADWARIQAAHPEVVWIHIHAHGLNLPGSQGAFVWVQADSKAKYRGDPADLEGLNVFYNTLTSLPWKIAVGGAWKGFDDSKAPWAAASAHLLPQDCGNTWLQTFKLLNEHYSAHNQLPFLQLVTWNDYEEGSALETGIATCTKTDARRAGQTLTLSVSYPETVDHLELYKQADGGALELVGRYPATTTSISLSDASAQAYFIKTVGKPFIENTVTGPIRGK